MNPAPDDLARATDQLRDRPLPRVVEIADAVLLRTMSVPRPAVHVRAAAPYAFTRVSSTVISAVLRERLDESLDGGAVRRLSLEVDRDERLSLLTLELLVQYDRTIVEVADRARALTRSTLTELIGTDPTDVAVQVAVSHVHVSDVTLGDPRFVDPDDE